MRFYFRPIFVGYIFLIPFLKDYLVSTYFIKDVVDKVDIFLIGVSIEICGRNIYQFLNFIENSINWFIKIKIHLIDHILTLGKHLRCDFYVGIEEMLEDDVDRIFDVGGITIAQYSDILWGNGFYDFIP